MHLQSSSQSIDTSHERSAGHIKSGNEPLRPDVVAPPAGGSFRSCLDQQVVPSRVQRQHGRGREDDILSARIEVREPPWLVGGPLAEQIQYRLIVLVPVLVVVRHIGPGIGREDGRNCGRNGPNTAGVITIQATSASVPIANSRGPSRVSSERHSSLTTPRAWIVSCGSAHALIRARTTNVLICCCGRPPVNAGCCRRPHRRRRGRRTRGWRRSAGSCGVA
jgi:hypothetical protein